MGGYSTRTSSFLQENLGFIPLPPRRLLSSYLHKQNKSISATGLFLPFPPDRAAWSSPNRKFGFFPSSLQPSRAQQGSVFAAQAPRSVASPKQQLRSCTSSLPSFSPPSFFLPPFHSLSNICQMVKPLLSRISECRVGEVWVRKVKVWAGIEEGSFYTMSWQRAGLKRFPGWMDYRDDYKRWRDSCQLMAGARLSRQRVQSEWRHSGWALRKKAQMGETEQWAEFIHRSHVGVQGGTSHPAHPYRRTTLLLSLFHFIYIFSFF